MSLIQSEKKRPPPRLVPAAEALPHLGGLKLAAYQGALPEETEPHPVTALSDAFDDQASQEMLKRALALPKVRDRLGRRIALQHGPLPLHQPKIILR